MGLRRPAAMACVGLLARGNADIEQTSLAGPSLTDTVEKVPGKWQPRNNRIVGTSFLNRTCAVDARLESILLGDPLKIFFRQYRPEPDLTRRTTTDVPLGPSPPPPSIDGRGD